MKTRSLRRSAFALACAMALAFALSGPVSAQRHGGGGWHGGGWNGGGWHGGGWHGDYGGYSHRGWGGNWGWGWGGIYVVPGPSTYCTYASCYPYDAPPYYPYYAYPPPYYGY